MYVNFTNMDFVNLVIAVGIPIITPFVKMPVVKLFNAPTDIQELANFFKNMAGASSGSFVSIVTSTFLIKKWTSLD